VCEHFVARAAGAFPIAELWPFTEMLERYGIAGFGWGAGWVDNGGSIRTHRTNVAFRDDARGQAAVGAVETTAVLVHLRRPSRLSWMSAADAQPFVDPDGRFAFSHNGDFRAWRTYRPAYRKAGRIHGRADTEVGQRWLEDNWRTDEPAGHLLGALHDAFGGQANLAVLAADGSVHHYAGNSENPVFAFRLGDLAVASTGIYSLDRSLFRFVAPGATDRRLVPLRTTVSLAA
jgi:glutamine phosphoribosylpyrophosphate amidotransferase